MKRGNCRSYARSASRGNIRIALCLLCFLGVSLGVGKVIHAQATASDPGVRGGAPGAGGSISGLTPQQLSFFEQNLGTFSEVNNVTSLLTGNTGLIGLGPTFDSNSCATCHAQPAIGGSSPPTNNLFSVYQLDGDLNFMPFFELPNGPTVVARFPYQSDGVTPDGSVHRLFTITGRVDAGSCNISQPDFVTAAAQNNLILRQTTPTFGDGLMEIIQNSDIVANMNSNLTLKQQLGIAGHPNYGTQDGTIGRFGWKAQSRSIMLFAAEAYNTEEGVTDEFFPSEGNQTSGCILNLLPEDHTRFEENGGSGVDDFTGDPERFAMLSRFFAPPAPAPADSSTINGQLQFNDVGCVLCHTTSFTTPASTVSALSKITTNLFSDLLVHHMGPCLADNVVQGTAQGDEFRTAPLWGVGQRYFFMHDGRTSDIVQAVEDHNCAANGIYPASEANGVVGNFNALSPQDQQDLINFLRSL